MNRTFLLLLLNYELGIEDPFVYEPILNPGKIVIGIFRFVIFFLSDLDYWFGMFLTRASCIKLVE